jgi:copper transport protein
VAILPLVGGVALAHANYVKSNPASDARLAKSPTEVRVTFSETPDPAGSDLAVLDTAGKRLSAPTVAAATDEANTLIVSVPALPEGGYLVSWTARSAVDGHETKGAFGFAIGNAPLPSIPDIGPSAPPPAPLEVAGRALSFAGIAGILGVSIFTLFIRPPVDESERRREKNLIAIAGALLLIGTTLTVESYGAGIPTRLLLFLTLRGFAGLIVIGALFVPERILRPDARREIAAFAGLAAGLWATLVSHAAASGDPKYIALDFIHVVAISIWSGGVVAFAFMAAPAVRDARALGALTWRFSLTALVCVAVLITTGTLQALDRLVLLEDLYETPYGIALLAKILLLVVLVSLGALNLLVWGPRLRRGVAARAGLLRGVAVETVLFLLVFVATSFLTALAPPAQANAAAFDETQRVEGVRIELLVATNNPGRNRYVVRVTQGLAPLTNAELVALRFTMVEHDMGEQELVATQRAPGEYVAQGSPTAMFGTWKVQTIVRLQGRLDLRALFTVPIANNGGQLAQVVTIAPYNLIVFAEPSEPQAGAPVTINIVLVNAQGDPVSGKTVRASFAGPGAPLDTVAAEDAAKLGPGRYQIAVIALDAGTWKITLAVGDEGTGVYTLDVAR